MPFASSSIRERGLYVRGKRVCRQREPARREHGATDKMKRYARGGCAAPEHERAAGGEREHTDRAEVEHAIEKRRVR
jgi:hypothetical protein